MVQIASLKQLIAARDRWSQKKLIGFEPVPIAVF